MADFVIRGAQILDGSGAPAFEGDVAIADGRIEAVGSVARSAAQTIDAQGLALAPGFIDVHTHDDLEAIRAPDMLPKISQGVTTVVVGNCGISAAPTRLRGEPPDPMNLLGERGEFVYPDFASYRRAVDTARPATNVVALIGHTALRQNWLDRLDRSATADEIAGMQRELRAALEAGAAGLSSGLAYGSAFAADTAEVVALAKLLDEAGGVYVTHLRDESDAVLDAIDEALVIGDAGKAPVIVSHLKCAGAGNWGRSGEVLRRLERAAATRAVGCDCYPYAASSTTLDVKQVTDAYEIFVTWSDAHPEQAGKTLREVARAWQCGLHEAARRLQPAGAVYHAMQENDVRRILAHPLTMIGSDGLPRDPRPHPRLWGAFPRVLAHYCREEKLFELPTAVHKMTGLSAARFGIRSRGLIRPGYWADLVLFDPARVRDTARFDDPVRAAEGIEAVWVNGALSYRAGRATGERAGRFLPREADIRASFQTHSALRTR